MQPSSLKTFSLIIMALKLKNEQNELFRKLVSTDIKIDLRRWREYSAYLQGASKAAMLKQKQFPELSKGKEDVYNMVALSLITDSLHNTDL